MEKCKKFACFSDQRLFSSSFDLAGKLLLMALSFLKTGTVTQTVHARKNTSQKARTKQEVFRC